jgi:hypothetical protein
MIYLFGKDIHQSLHHLDSLRKKKAKLLGTLAFLLRCQDQKVIPACLKEKHHVYIQA